MVKKPNRLPPSSKGNKREVSLKSDPLMSPRSSDVEKLISSLSIDSTAVLKNAVPKNNTGSHSFYDLTMTKQTVEHCENTLKLLLIEPHFVFTYWEITDKAILDAGNSIGSGAKLTLRYYDISNSTELGNCKYWDIEIFDRIGKWYLRLERPDQRLHLEFGLKDETKKLTKISSADFLYMPKENVAGPGPHKWTIAKSGSNISENPAAKAKFIDADPKILKKIMGPYFFDILIKGQFPSIINSSTEALFPLISEPSSE
ncbi:MAG: DUF4912 domain-containing protein [Deltaproteobacteria bacterium]|jgi:hypothetical protein|nr:DUF4912 domain-containing protein [Deltaproteobacteria bacterium]